MKPALILLALGLAVSTNVDAQIRNRRGASRFDGNVEQFNVAYDGRFTFVRIRFTPTGFDGFPDRKWDHDWPRAERNFTKMLDELTGVGPRMRASNILAADDPEIFKYPIAYLCEPGYWTVSAEEADNLRTYLFKGGFIIFDDFVGPDWYNFADKLQVVLPGYQLVRLDQSHPIFDSFFDIDELSMEHPVYAGYHAEYFGVYEDNDVNKRLMAIVNYNNDIGDYWEWSDAGFLPIELSNEAYKLGINYIVYAMTH